MKVESDGSQARSTNPDYSSAVKMLANAISRDDELAIGVIQVGDDVAASRSYKDLDKKIKTGGLFNRGAKFDIFDVKTPDELDEFDSIEAIIEDFFNEDHESN